MRAVYSPVSASCQRWYERRESYRHLRESGFNPSQYEVVRVSKPEPEAFVMAHHYSGSTVLTVRAFNLYTHGRLVGAALFSQPVNDATVYNLWGWPVYEPSKPERAYRGDRWLAPGLPLIGADGRLGRPGTLELGRLVLLDEVPGRAETWFVAQCFRALEQQGFLGIVSFSDPFPRTRADGGIVFPGHVGWIYQGLNAVYTGRADAAPLRLFRRDGLPFNGRSWQKVRGGGRETGFANQVARLCSYGAPRPRRGELPSAWVKRALDATTHTVRHPGNYRYAWTLGTRRDRAHYPVLAEQLPYPKQAEEITGQLMLSQGVFGK